MNPLSLSLSPIKKCLMIVVAPALQKKSCVKNVAVVSVYALVINHSVLVSVIVALAHLNFSVPFFVYLPMMMIELK